MDVGLLARAGRAVGKCNADRREFLALSGRLEVGGQKVEQGQLVLDRPVDEWLDLATARPGLHLAEMTRPILVGSCQLPQPFPGDPADQIIVATARHHGAVLVSKDRHIRRYAQVRSVW